MKSMESRIEIDEQYNDDMRDTRTLRQKVSMLLVPYYMYIHALLDLYQREAETRLKVYDKKCEKRLAVSLYMYEQCHVYVSAIHVDTCTVHGMCIIIMIMHTLVIFYMYMHTIHTGPGVL